MGRGDPFAAAIRGTRMPMVITDPRQPDNPIVFANEAFQNLTGYALGEIIGRNCRFLQGPESDRAAVGSLADALREERALNVDILNYRKDGSTFWNALYVSPVRGEGGDLQFFFASQLDVTDRIEAQRVIAEQKAIVEAEVERRTRELAQALEAKTTLLHEVDHRVKNNLTMIGSLLRLQSRTLSDPVLRQTLENMLERVDALAAIHRRLYQSEDVGKFDVGAFAQNLASDVIGASGRGDIRLEANVEPLEIAAANAAAVGLILNELLTNAIKHAFANGRTGVLRLSVQRMDGQAVIDLADDGPGFDPALVTEGSIGKSLVDRLSRQIKARTSWDGSRGGTHVRVQFPVGAPS